ncbi:AAA family ATPase [Ectopseudomonas mendocina]|uniref:ATPase n=1 Tax=Ectopseudomonas mendocina TaxID=300 RepID=A0A2R3QNQ1_ECTME|nr:AAA family ATPase [Pseudomonas mendocina]AVO53405.1 ATPase [Pseudomonas mendocina]
MQLPPFHVLTGGPGSGKSSLLTALAQAGHNVVEETGRAIIRDQQAIDGHGLPWREPQLFAELMLAWELRAHRQALALREPVFFDRSLMDVIGYLRLSGLPVARHLLRAARQLRYQPQVFLLPHWPQIYCNDAERRQDAAEAERTAEVMREVYADFGYQLIDVPPASLEQRRDFVLQHCGLTPRPRSGNAPA